MFVKRPTKSRTTGLSASSPILVTAVILSWLWSTPLASACDLCAVYSASQALGEARKGFTLGLAEQFTHARTLQFDGAEVPNPGSQFFDSSITQLVPGYNFSDRLGVELSVPFIHRTFRRLQPAGLHKGRETGLGDVSLLATYEVLQHNSMKWTMSVDLFGGVKFPTGSTSRLREEAGEAHEGGAELMSAIHGHDLTLGSGSFDGLAGARLFARWRKFYGTASLQYFARTKGDYDYRFANDLVWAAGPGYFVFSSEAFSLALGLTASGETKGFDRLHASRVDDTSVTSFYLGPEMALTVGENVSAAVGLDLPIVLDNTGLQTVPDFRVRAGLTWRF